MPAFREALKERPRERVPLEWAGTQHKLETALKLVEERKRQTPTEPQDNEAPSNPKGSPEVAIHCRSGDVRSSVAKQNFVAHLGKISAAMIDCYER